MASRRCWTQRRHFRLLGSCCCLALKLEAINSYYKYLFGKTPHLENGTKFPQLVDRGRGKLRKSDPRFTTLSSRDFRGKPRISAGLEDRSRNSSPQIARATSRDFFSTLGYREFSAENHGSRGREKPRGDRTVAKEFRTFYCFPFPRKN